jgi:hypothetical protein
MDREVKLKLGRKDGMKAVLILAFLVTSPMRFTSHTMGILRRFII